VSTTDALVGRFAKYPEPELSSIVAVLFRFAAVNSVNVTVAELAPAGIVTEPNVPLRE
jgi:hypothetical protein